MGISIILGLILLAAAALIAFFAVLALIGAEARHLRKSEDLSKEIETNDSFAAEIDYYAKK